MTPNRTPCLPSTSSATSPVPLLITLTCLQQARGAILSLVTSEAIDMNNNFQHRQDEKGVK